MHWTRVKISDVLTEREGRYKVTDKALKGLQRIDKIDFDGNVHLSEKPSKTDMIIVHPGDLVISGINVHKGAIAVYEGQVPVAATIHYSSYTFDDRKLRVEYFKEYLKSEAFLKVLKDQVPGGIKTEIKPKHFLPLEIDLPGRKSQNVLLDRFRGIETKRKALTTELAHQRALLKQLRQAILQEAVQGKLTEAWRGELPKRVRDDYHASELLKRIRAEKEALVKAGKLRKPKPLPPIKPEEVPFELPKGWVWAQAEELTKPGQTITYGVLKPVWVDAGVPTVRVKDMVNGEIVLDDIAQCLPARAMKFRKTTLEEGDLLIAKDGATLGKTGFVPPQLAGGNITQHVVRFPIHSLLSRQFIRLVIDAPYGQLKLTTDTKGVALPGVNVGDFRKLPIPVPPLAEQQMIAERVAKMFDRVAAMGQECSLREFATDALLQSVLSEVMGGPGAVRYAEAGGELPLAAEPQVRQGRATKASTQVHEGH